MHRHEELWGCLSDVCIIDQEASEISETGWEGRVMKKEQVLQIKSDEKSFSGDEWQGLKKL